VLEALDISYQWDVHTKYRFGNPVWGHSVVEGSELHLMETVSDSSLGKVPNVRGLGAKDALYLMEQCGLHVQIAGCGKVVTQSIAPGTPVVKGRTVVLTLR
jgi:cell division protein FtsI (penicillin-binding protein 3)